MRDALGIGNPLEQAPHDNPARRDLPVGEAVKAMGLHSLGFIKQALSLVPRYLQHTPTYRRIAPRVTPAQRTDDARGRTLETLYAYGGTDLSRLIAATAAQRLGLPPGYAHLDTTSVHGDGRSNRAEEPEEQVVHLTQGSRRAHRSDLTHVMLELSIAHQAGMPVLMQPLRGTRREAPACGHVIRTPIEPLRTTYAAPDLVTDSALSSEAHFATLA